MSLKRKILLTGAILLFLSLVLVCLLVAGYFYLPSYLESKIIPRLAAGAGLTDFSVNVRNIGFFNADLGTLRIGPPDNPAIEIRSVRIDYSPRGLYQRKINKVAISGIELHWRLADGRLELQGVDINEIIAGQQSGGGSARPSIENGPPIVLEKMEIRDSRAILGADKKSYRIPFDIDIVPHDPEFNKFDIAAHLYPRGEKFTATAMVYRSQRRAKLKIEPADLDLERFADLAAKASGLIAAGDLTLQAEAEISWNPLQLSSLNASLILNRGKIQGDGFKLQTTSRAENDPMSFRLDLSAQNSEEMTFSGSSLLLIEPVFLKLAGFDGSFKRSGSALETSGQFRAFLQSTTPLPSAQLPLEIKDALPLPGRFSTAYDLSSGNWECEVTGIRPEGSGVEDVNIYLESYRITSKAPDFKLSARGGAKVINADYVLTAPAVRVASGSETVSVPEVLVKGTAKLEPGANGSSSLKFDIQAPNTGITMKEGRIKIPKFTLSGKLNQDADRQISTEGLIQFSGTGGSFSGLGARIRGARGKIPFKWPLKGKIASGSVAVTGLKFRDRELGSISSQIRQTAAGFSFNGRHQSALFPRMKINFSGDSKLLPGGPAEAEVRLDISRPAAAPEMDLGNFHPGAKDVRIKGKLQLNGSMNVNLDGLNGNVHFDLKNGKLIIGENDLEVEGLNMALNFPELPKIRSAPGQQINFTRISLGEFAVQEGRIEFQIESIKSILIEKMRFLWCSGNVETQAIRLVPDSDEYHVTFYCDRLNLAQVLEQFGAGSADGRGTVNGRIPIKYEKGKIHFEDGFLFSTPGENNKIHLTSTDRLTAGIPPGTPHYFQVELAREALKDYDYKWAKVNINSKGEELLLQMQMDGKPSQPLPFVYNKEIGGFMKVEANARGSKFEGIRLDVNFRLPLNQLLRYRGLLDMIQ